MLYSCLRSARDARAALVAVPLACALFSGSGRAEPIATQASTMPDIVASQAAVPAGAVRMGAARPVLKTRSSWTEIDCSYDALASATSPR